jgi:hypothetical protein
VKNDECRREHARAVASLARLLFLATVVACSAVTHGQVRIEEPTQTGSGSWLVSPTQVMGSAFSIKVSFRANPISGAAVSLIRAGDPPSSKDVVATSNAQGVAEFEEVSPGTYNVTVETVSQGIEVEPNLTGLKQLHLQWPDTYFSVQHIRGWLNIGPDKQGTPQPLQLALVRLLDLRSLKLIARTYTDARGYYEFPSASSGLYVLRFNEDPDSQSAHCDAAVEVGSTSAEQHVPPLKMGSPCDPRLSR